MGAQIDPLYNAITFLNKRDDLDYVSHVRKLRDVEKQLNLIKTCVHKLMLLKTTVNNHNNITPSSVTAKDAQTARELFDDLLDHTNFLFEHKALQSYIHYDPYRTDF